MIDETSSLMRSPSQRLAQPPKISQLEVLASNAQAVSSLRKDMSQTNMGNKGSGSSLWASGNVQTYNSCYKLAGRQFRAPSASMRGSGLQGLYTKNQHSQHTHLPLGGLPLPCTAGVLQTRLPQSITSTLLR